VRRQLSRLAPFALLLVLWVPSAGAWTWPVSGPVLQGFTFDHAHPYASGQHRGIDIGAAGGAAVLAPTSGVVSYAGTVPTSGKSVTIETPDGLSVTLTHLGSIAVARNAAVVEGAVVGTVGPSGTPEVDGPYVHFGIRTTADDQGYLDPLGFLPVLALPVPVAPAPAVPVEPPVAPPVVVDPPAPVAPAVVSDPPAAAAPAVVSDPAAAVEPPAASSAPPAPVIVSEPPAAEPVSGTAAPAPPEVAPPVAEPSVVTAPPPALAVAPAAPAVAPSATAAPAPAPSDVPAPAVIAETQPVPPPTADAPLAPTPEPTAVVPDPPGEVVRASADALSPAVAPEQAEVSALSRVLEPLAFFSAAVGLAWPPAALEAPLPAARTARTPVRAATVALPVRPSVAAPAPTEAAAPRAHVATRSPVAATPAAQRPRSLARTLLAALGVALLVLCGAVAACVGAVRIIRSPSPRTEGARPVAVVPEDPRRARLAVRERPAPHRPRGGLRRAGGRVRPVPAAEGQRRADGQRDGRARHPGDGVRRPERRIAA
jgi:Peptidase family M23